MTNKWQKTFVWEKKLILVGFVLLVSVGLLYSQTITVTKPSPGDNWCKGRKYTITWTKSGSMNANVKLGLYSSDGNALIRTITNGAANNGAYEWTIPSDIPTGTYVVNVKTVDNAVSDNSNSFTIKTCFATKAIGPVHQLKPIHVQQRPFCTIKAINPTYNTSSKVTFRVDYTFPQPFQVAGHPVTYCLAAYVPNKASHDKIYFHYPGCTSQGIPFAKDQSSTIDVFYGSLNHNEPLTYTSSTVEIQIWERQSSKIVCSKTFNFNHTWYHRIDHGDVVTSPAVLTIRYGQNVKTINQGGTAGIEIPEDCNEDWFDRQAQQIIATADYTLRNTTTKNLKFNIFLRYGNRAIAYPNEIVLLHNQSIAIHHNVRLQESGNTALNISIEGPVGISDDTRIVFFSGRLMIRVYAL